MPRGDIMNGELLHAERESLDGRIKKLSKLISWSFYAYAAIITLLRLLGFGRLAMGFVEGIVYRFQMTAPRTDFPFNLLSLRIRLYSMPLTAGGYLFALLPAVIALYSLKTRFNERSRRLVAGFSILAVINHGILLAAFIVSWVWVFLMAPGTLYVAPAIMVSQIAFMLFLYILSGKLKTLKIQARYITNDDGLLTAPNFCVAIIFIISPFLGTPPGVMLSNVSSALGIFSDVRVITSDDCRLLTSKITSIIRVSPDGKLIAMGGENDLSVWDVESKELLFNDTTISARSVRFSDSGKYLAAVGSPTSKDILNSSVALYEVEGFRRVPEVALPTDTRHGRKTMVLDVAFRADEKSFVYVYYSYWDKKQLTSAEWTEKLELEPGPRRYSPTFHEIEMPSGKTIAVKEFPELKLRDRAVESFRFTTDGSVLTYRHDIDDELFGWTSRNFTLYDTVTWEEKTIVQNIHNRVLSFIVASGENNLDDALDNINSRKIFFTHKFHKSPKYFLAELNISDATANDLIDIDNTSIPNASISSIALSPDGKKIAVVGDEGEIWSKDFCIFIYNLEKKTLSIEKFRPARNFKILSPIRMTWLSNDKAVLATLSIFTNEGPGGRGRMFDGYFFYVDLHDEEG